MRRPRSTRVWHAPTAVCGCCRADRASLSARPPLLLLAAITHSPAPQREASCSSAPPHPSLTAGIVTPVPSYDPADAQEEKYAVTQACSACHKPRPRSRTRSLMSCTPSSPSPLPTLHAPNPVPHALDPVPHVLNPIKPLIPSLMHALHALNPWPRRCTGGQVRTAQQTLHHMHARVAPDACISYTTCKGHITCMHCTTCMHYTTLHYHMHALYHMHEL